MRGPTSGHARQWKLTAIRAVVWKEMMMRKFLSEVLFPLLRRVGSVGAGYLVAQGADAELAQQVVTGGLAAVAIAADLAVSHWERSRR